ncbi:hypothetical protein KA005_14035 [bacterium]|nr:hypothetical protein [bacterium]
MVVVNIVELLHVIDWLSVRRNMEEYPISDDIALLNDKSCAAKKMVELAMKLPFGYRKALRAATDAIRFERLFWTRVREVYSPVFNGKMIEYNNMKQTVTEHMPANKSLEPTEEGRGISDKP